MAIELAKIFGCGMEQKEIFPVRVKEAKKTFRDFYISLRSEGYEEEDHLFLQQHGS
jgi:hypothetical protein